MTDTGAGVWVLKKRKRNEVVTRTHPINFIFENPLFGRFKDMYFTKEMLEEYPDYVFTRPTSYCHYGMSYMKATVFIGTLSRFQPKLPCRKNPCKEYKTNRCHASQVKEQSAAEKNSIPGELVDLEVESWMQDYPNPDQRFLFIDVFAGYGSVAERIRTKYPKVFVYANDIVRRKDNNVELDVNKFPMSFLFNLALQKHFGDPTLPDMPDGLIPWLRAEKIAVLFHLSTPCNTYSVDGLAANRDKNTLIPHSALGRAHDEMNTKIMNWLKRLCF